MLPPKQALKQKAEQAPSQAQAPTSSFSAP
jgi:hypothetical protein